ncbi:FAD-dependent oxidoreductase [Nonomuraea sp. B1E8]|uniref:NAD(P)/FAD-dependent oxidoreductase n=1 Tax=unclassified Nonomuraea TaxID=2593643 RepID=UPI00325EA449
MRVVVIGSGIIGAAAAYYLTGRGATVTVVESGYRGQATEAGAGIVCPWVDHAEDEAWYQLTREGARDYPALVEELGEDIGYAKVGALLVTEEPAELEQVRALLHRRYPEAPEMGEITDVSTPSELFPPLSDDLSAILVPGAARVNGRAVREALLRAAIARGAQVRTGIATLTPGGDVLLRPVGTTGGTSPLSGPANGDATAGRAGPAGDDTAAGPADDGRSAGSAGGGTLAETPGEAATARPAGSGVPAGTAPGTLPGGQAGAGATGGPAGAERAGGTAGAETTGGPKAEHAGGTADAEVTGAPEGAKVPFRGGERVAGAGSTSWRQATPLETTDVPLTGTGAHSFPGEGVPLDADVVIVAAGAWTGEVCRPLGVKLPIFPRRGQILHVTLEGIDTAWWPIVLPRIGPYLLGFPGSRVVIGATIEDVGFSPRVTMGGLGEVIDAGLRVAPGLLGATVAETRVGLRPVYAPGCALIGRLTSRVVVATGLSSYGLTAGPFTGRIAAALALGEEPPVDLTPYAPAVA